MGNCSNQPETLYGNSISLKRVEKFKIRFHLFRNNSKVLPGSPLLTNMTDETFKALLTHPTVLQLFEKHCFLVGAEKSLNFYLLAGDIRKQIEERKSSEDIFMSFEELRLYQPFDNQITNIEPLMCYDIFSPKNELSVRMEKLRLAQYEAFYNLKMNIWPTFSLTNDFKLLLVNKDVTRLLQLSRDSSIIFRNVLGRDDLTLCRSVSSSGFRMPFNIFPTCASDLDFVYQPVSSRRLP